ncbi:HAD family phosphatase [Brachybacterium sp. UMB0905]|uniref:HAD family hydrolase n=1 Tax=Brachybacterium sp. UMB0905 TaxID=2069310 RepID=UPI000C7FF0F3|nr:HAD family phosphatase [Brachybacterium sp. UMB0905]PMC76801.1 HAD family phosphatase [Brachybacterium sp. UMB0905]
MTGARIPERFAAVFGDWTPQAVVFDCDGLLLDTESVWQQTQDAVVEQLQAHLDEADEDVLHGSTLEDAADLIAKRAKRPVDEVHQMLLENFEQRLAAGVHPMPGAPEIVAAAGAKLPLGCASNSWMEALEEKLTAGGLREHFTVLKASDSVEHPKPAPDMYVAAARELGADPGHTLAFEDSGTGARAARDGGLRLIAVPAPGYDAPPADLALTSLEDPELQEWIASW